MTKLELFRSCVILTRSAYYRQTKVVIDFLIFRTKLVPRLLGTPVSLTIAQAKGWPAQLFGWGLIDFIMLWGDRRFAKHWFYWQDIIRMMNATNPSGNITHSNIYLRVLCSAIGLGFAVTLVRTWVNLTVMCAMYMLHSYSNPKNVYIQKLQKRGIFGQLVGKRVVRKCSIQKLTLAWFCRLTHLFFVCHASKRKVITELSLNP